MWNNQLPRKVSEREKVYKTEVCDQNVRPAKLKQAIAGSARQSGAASAIIAQVLRSRVSGFGRGPWMFAEECNRSRTYQGVKWREINSKIRSLAEGTANFVSM